MPSVNPDESRSHFVSRRIAYLFNKEGERSKSHAAAKCNGMYDQYLKNKRKK